MHQKLILRLGLPVIILVTSIFLLSNGKAEEAKKPVKDTKSTCSKKNMNACSGPETRGNEDMILENLSRQFISIPISH